VPASRAVSEALSAASWPPASAATRCSLPGRFHPQIRDQNRRDIGKSQSIWTACKIETPGSPRLDHFSQRRVVAPLPLAHRRELAVQPRLPLAALLRGRDTDR
jgi:hypothetical protein